MVFPYMDHDLCGLLANKAFRPTTGIVKLLMRQLLEGLGYIHGVSESDSSVDVLFPLGCLLMGSDTLSIVISKQPTS